MYKKGQHKFICDVCGFERYSEVKKKRWDGLIVCPEDYEVDHPQKYIRVSPDGLPVSDPRPEPADVFAYICYAYANQGYADIAEADCAQADKTTLTYAYAALIKGS
jgi:hypothetical protein